MLQAKPRILGPYAVMLVKVKHHMGERFLLDATIHLRPKICMCDDTNVAARHLKAQDFNKNNLI